MILLQGNFSQRWIAPFAGPRNADSSHAQMGSWFSQFAKVESIPDLENAALKKWLQWI
jgi:hypothetical protein